MPSWWDVYDIHVIVIVIVTVIVYQEIGFLPLQLQLLSSHLPSMG